MKKIKESKNISIKKKVYKKPKLKVLGSVSQITRGGSNLGTDEANFWDTHPPS